MSQPNIEAELADAHAEYQKEIKGIKDPMPFEDWLEDQK